MTQDAAVALEAFLARLYVDAGARAAFLADPAGTARQAGLADADVQGLVRIDRVGLALAADSFARKRGHQGPPRR